MAITKITPRPVPLEAAPNLRQWLDEQIQRMALLLNNAAQLENELIPDSILSPNVALRDAANTFTGYFELSGNSSFTGNPRITGNAPSLRFVENDAGVNEKDWFLFANSGVFGLVATPDGLATSTVRPLQVFRTGTTISEIELNSTLLDVNANADFSGTLHAAGTISSSGLGSFGGGVETVKNSASGFTSWRNNNGGVPSNQGRWDWAIGSTSGDLLLRALNDDGSVGSTVLQFSRNSSAVRHINISAPLRMSEQASAAASAAGRGQIWVKNTTPCQLWFTDDAGNDTQIV